jgi:type IV pilus assembly protein PilE
MRRLHGFTLVELMIVVAIIGVLAMIAVPSYNDYITRSKLQEAAATLADLRVKLESAYMDNRTYLDAGGACNVPGGNAPARTRYFTYICAPAAQTYLVTAVGDAAQGLSGFNFTIDQANTKATVITGGSPAAASGWTNAACWVQKKGGVC